jgi:hypothetical protein
LGICDVQLAGRPKLRENGPERRDVTEQMRAAAQVALVDRAALVDGEVEVAGAVKGDTVRPVRSGEAGPEACTVPDGSIFRIVPSPEAVTYRLPPLEAKLVGKESPVANTLVCPLGRTSTTSLELPVLEVTNNRPEGPKVRSVAKGMPVATTWKELIPEPNGAVTLRTRPPA